MEIGSTSVEQETALHDGLAFVTKQDVEAGDDSSHAYKIEGPEGFVVAMMAGAEIGPEFRDAEGNPLDSSTRITIQKCNKQGSPLGNGRAFTELLGRFDYGKMLTDPDYTRGLSKDLMVDEREIVKVYVDVPAGSSGFNAANSRLTIGDDTSDFGTPVEIIDHDDLSEQESAAVKQASQAGN